MSVADCVHNFETGIFEIGKDDICVLAIEQCSKILGT